MILIDDQSLHSTRQTIQTMREHHIQIGASKLDREVKTLARKSTFYAPVMDKFDYSLIGEKLHYSDDIGT